MKADRSVQSAVRVGCAGWSIPRPSADRFPPGASHLERYALVFTAVEIDSSFYRDHEPETYARWAAATPPQFRFAVKLHREITHFGRLVRVTAPLSRTLATIEPLGRKMGPLLVQLPPSLGFDARRADAFFRTLRRRHRGQVVCEPRHATWFTDAAGALLRRHRIGRVAADPAPVPAAGEPGGWPKVVYYRLHGSPQMYYSAYSDDFLGQLATKVRAVKQGATVWVIFDNTAAGAAIENALALLEKLP